jgi:hypothetical protein
MNWQTLLPSFDFSLCLIVQTQYCAELLNEDLLQKGIGQISYCVAALYLCLATSPK